MRSAVLRTGFLFFCFLASLASVSGQDFPDPADIDWNKPEIALPKLKNKDAGRRPPLRPTPVHSTAVKYKYDHGAADAYYAKGLEKIGSRERVVRRDLNDELTPEQRRRLVAIMMEYLTDTVVKEHPCCINHTDHHLFIDHDRYILDIEAYLVGRGFQEFVPLPAWDAAKPIPKEFRVVRNHDDGTKREPLNNMSPNIRMPDDFRLPAVCKYLDDSALVRDTGGWHGSVHGTIGGSMSSFDTASAAPIFWPWHAFVSLPREALKACPNAKISPYHTEHKHAH